MFTMADGSLRRSTQNIKALGVNARSMTPRVNCITPSLYNLRPPQPPERETVKFCASLTLDTRLLIVTDHHIGRQEAVGEEQRRRHENHRQRRRRRCRQRRRAAATAAAPERRASSVARLHLVDAGRGDYAAGAAAAVHLCAAQRGRLVGGREHEQQQQQQYGAECGDFEVG